MLNDSLIEELGLAAIYTRTNGTILRASGDFRRFLELPKTGFSNNIFDFIPVSFVTTLKNAFKVASEQDQKATIDNIRLPQMKEGETVKISCVPYFNDDKKKKELLLIFLPNINTQFSQDAVQIKHVEGLEKDHVINKLKQDLKYANLSIASLRNQIDVNGEELQTSNEELMATNEELQSTNEELQSVNEELYAVNAELNEKIKDLTQASDDIDNLLNSTKIEVILVDKELRIRKTTSLIDQLFNVNQNCIGVPLLQCNPKLQQVTSSDIVEISNSTIQTGNGHQKEVQSTNGRWYVQQIMPFVNSRNVVDGAIISYVDITEIKRLFESNQELERFAYIASHDLQEPLRNIMDFIVLLKDAYKDKLGKDGMEYLKFIDEAAHRMGDLVRDILSYSRLSARKDSVEVNLQTTLDNVMSDLRKKIEEQGAQIDIISKCQRSMAIRWNVIHCF